MKKRLAEELDEIAIDQEAMKQLEKDVQNVNSIYLIL
jgi:hypothetical protein